MQASHLRNRRFKMYYLAFCYYRIKVAETHAISHQLLAQTLESLRLQIIAENRLQHIVIFRLL